MRRASSTVWTEAAMMPSGHCASASERRIAPGFFRGHSVPVNEKLSEIFLQLHISEKTGRGIPVISSEYGEGAFDFSDNDITVTIPFSFINEVGDKVGDKTLSDSPN